MAARRKDFWELVDKAEECWLWTGQKTVKGYPVYRGRYAHRLAVELSGRVIPDGMQVDHICHVLACVNPRHLQVVPNRLNAQNRSGAYRTSKSGVRGVSWHKGAGKWVVQVTVDGATHYGGLFAELPNAEAAAIAMRNRLMTNNQIDRRAS